MEKTLRGQLHIGHEPLILVGNHNSYLDIPLIMSINPQCCFVAKQEVKSWPVIGKAGVKIDTIFVKRESQSSRKSVRSQIQEALLSGQKQLVIFPSGTTTLGPSRQWRKGAFEIAKSGNIRMQAFRLRYRPARAAAYIDQDFFPLHMLNLMKFPKVVAELEFGEVFRVTDVEKDLARTKAWCEDDEFKPESKSSQEYHAPRESGSYSAHDFL